MTRRRAATLGLALLLPSLGGCGGEELAALRFEISAGTCSPTCDDVQLEVVVVRDAPGELAEEYCLQRAERAPPGKAAGQLQLAGLELDGAARLQVGVRVFCQSEPACVECAALKTLEDFAPAVHFLSLQSSASCFPPEAIDTRFMEPCAGL